MRHTLVEQLQAVINIIPTGLIVIDGHGRVKQANDIAKKILSLDPTGDTWISVIQKVFRPQSDDGYEVSLVNGSRVSVRTEALGNEPGQIVLLEDMTASKLWDEHKHRNQRLMALGNMIASLAHQLRTPLATAILYAGHLKQGVLSKTKQTNFTHKLFSRLKLLEQEINNMLLFARGGSSIVSEISLSEFVENFAHAELETLAQHQINFKIENRASTDTFIGNADSISGALRNLLQNALELPRDNLAIKLIIYEKNENLYFVMQDNGPGIEKNVREKLFSPFNTSKNHGTGLGLAIVKAIANAHEGEVVVESNGEGTQIGFYLPLVMATAKATA
jgi:two-component system sensor histidine kinase FlrB